MAGDSMLTRAFDGLQALAPAGALPFEHQGVSRAVNGCEQQPGDEGEMVHEKSKFRLVAVPVRRSMKGESQEELRLSYASIPPLKLPQGRTGSDIGQGRCRSLTNRNNVAITDT
jgi:hypothetical protein